MIVLISKVGSQFVLFSTFQTMKRWLPTSILLILLLLPKFKASPGDNLDFFQDCLSDCSSSLCSPNSLPNSLPNDNHHGQPSDALFTYPSKWEKLIWSCEANCDYQCQQLTTSHLRSLNEPIEQFHGKWPFLRIAGIQEIFSAIFSIGNLVANLISLKLFVQFSTSDLVSKKLNGRRIVNKYFGMIFVSCLAWSFSTIFHIRDTDVTETMDYFAAFATVLTGFNVITIRTFELYQDSRKLLRWGFTGLCLAIYACHIHRMIVDWGYVYNMKINIFFGVLQNIQWFYLSIQLYQKNSNVYSLTPILLNLIIILGMLFEVFEFFWFDLIDSHAMWHFVSIWPTVFWYKWQIWDLKNIFRSELIKKTD